MSLKEIFDNQKPVGDAAKYHTASGEKGMVSCAVKEAAEAGEAVLEDGGNAIDAVIAMQLALTAVEGMNTSIAAGGYILYYDNKKKETKVLNGHSKAPAATTPDIFYNKQGELIPFDERSISPKSVGIPGIMKMLELAHETYGSMTLERLIDPAIELAENEFRVNSLWERTIDNFKDRLGEEARKVFVPDGKPLEEEDVIRQPNLAKALKTIRKEGFSSVYEGEIADAIIETLEAMGGIMRKEDLDNYEASIEEPLWGNYKGYELAFPGPPNGGGFAISQLLTMLEKLHISQYDVHSWEKYHLVAEAIRVVLADQQTHIGDPAFVKLPLKGLFMDKYIDERRKLIDFQQRKQEQDINPGDPWKYEEGNTDYKQKQDQSFHGMETTHFTAIDKWGNIAACTSSIERIFGSGIMVPGYGFILNNDLTDFNPEPGTVNEANANKFAVSSKTPTIVYDEGKPFFTLGSPGAETIVGSVAQVLLHVLDYKMDLGKAVDEPRIFNNPQLSWEWEDGINEQAMEKLKELGYELDRGFENISADDRLGDVKGILIDPWSGQLYGTADSPRPGRAIGVKDNNRK
jgi:gamma-glutamyltranspeptidase/glutathione hydrolase